MNESVPIDENEFARRLEKVENAARNHEPLGLDAGVRDDDPETERFVAAAQIVGMIHRVRRTESPATRDTAENNLETTPHIELPDNDLEDSFLETFDNGQPRRLGRFRIRRLLGKGGYGLVFLAHDPQLERDVAIKVPRLETILNEEMASRFAREAKAAAALSHPNIVPVFEAGQIGRICFIAYQYVDGITLTQWLDQMPEGELPDPRQAAELVAVLSDAVHHAHQRGILHRDLKPANVMLSRGAPGEFGASEKNDQIKTDCLQSVIPLITDFGLSKIIAPDEIPVAKNDQTRTGALVGTPAYMAPEQIRAKKDLIGPPTDVYALGVLFCELLTRKNPFVRDSLIQTIEAVQLEDPRPPSDQSRKISRDLDAIVSKCLEKDSARRYPTAADLRADIHRYLNGEAVQARRITVATRTARWISRNRVVAALLVLLAIGTTAATIGLLKAQRAERDARIAEKAAIVEAGTAATVSEFLEDIFNVPDLLGSKPGQQRGREITAEDILKHGAEKIRTELDDQPVVKARLMTRIGSILVQLGSYQEGEELLREGLAVAKSVLAEDRPELAESHRQLAKLLLLRQRTQEAEAELRTAIEILQIDETANRKDLSAAYNDLGLLLKTTDLRGARDAYRKALDLRGNDQSSSLWRLEANIAAIDARLADYENARIGFERAFETAIQSYGTDEHPAVATIMNNLAFVYRKLGDFHQARQLQERNLEISEAKLGSDHPQVGSALIGLATICQRMGDYDASTNYGTRAIEVNSKSLPSEHRNITISMARQAETLMRMGDYDSARKLMADAITQTELRDDGEVAIQRIRNQLLLSTIERMASNLNTASELIEKSFADPVVDNDLNVGMSVRFARALLMAQMGNEEASAAFSEAIQFAETLEGLSDADRSYFQSRFWALSNQDEKALDDLQRAVESGFRDAVLLTDPDLESIRSDPRYRSIAQRVESDLSGD